MYLKDSDWLSTANTRHAMAAVTDVHETDVLTDVLTEQETLELPSALDVTVGMAWWVVPAVLLFLTCLSVLVHGYHFGAEDEAVYLPGIKKILSPGLYPHDAIFFFAQTRATVFPYMIALSTRLSRLPLNWTVFLWHLSSLYLFFAGCWGVAKRCFRSFADQVGAVGLVAVMLTLPVAGTSLYIADQYLQPRTLATALILFAICAVLDDRKWVALAWTLAATLLHPLMAVLGAGYLLFLWLPTKRYSLRFAAFAPGLVSLDAWRHAVQNHGYLFVQRWEWYEWLGIIGPLVILWWFRRIAKNNDSPAMERLIERLIWFSIFCFAVAVLIAIPAQLQTLALAQPMRYLHLAYILMLLLAGGLLRRYVLREKVWRWALVFGIAGAGMFMVQRSLFPDSPHVELPGTSNHNQWVQAFHWVAGNTPQDSYFVIDPNYMERQGEDAYGFRAIAERSQLADYSKDAGVAAIVPSIAPEWERQVKQLQGFRQFSRQDFLRLKQEDGVNWAVVQSNAVAGLNCPYRNETVAVCKIE